MRPAHQTLSNRHTSPATGLSLIKEWMPSKDVRLTRHRHVPPAPQVFVVHASATKRAAVSGARRFARYLGHSATSRQLETQVGLLKKCGPTNPRAIGPGCTRTPPLLQYSSSTHLPCSLSSAFLSFQPSDEPHMVENRSSTTSRTCIRPAI